MRIPVSDELPSPFGPRKVGQSEPGLPGGPSAATGTANLSAAKGSTMAIHLVSLQRTGAILDDTASRQALVEV